MPYFIGNRMYCDSSYNHLCKNSNNLILYNRIDIHHDSKFPLNYIHFHSIHIYIYTIHVELKTLFHLPVTLNKILLHSYFHFICNTNLSMCINSVTTSTTLISTKSTWMKRVSLRLISRSVGLVWHGLFFRNIHFKRRLKLEARSLWFMKT